MQGLGHYFLKVKTGVLYYNVTKWVESIHNKSNSVKIINIQRKKLIFYKK